MLCDISPVHLQLFMVMNFTKPSPWHKKETAFNITTRIPVFMMVPAWLRWCLHVSPAAVRPCVSPHSSVLASQSFPGQIGSTTSFTKPQPYKHWKDKDENALLSWNPWPYNVTHYSSMNNQIAFLISSCEAQATLGKRKASSCVFIMNYIC